MSGAKNMPDNENSDRGAESRDTLNFEVCTSENLL